MGKNREALKEEAIEKNKKNLINEEKEKKVIELQAKNIEMPGNIMNLRTKDKAAIVGFAPSWKEAPYDDPGFQIFGINELYAQATNRKFDIWAEIHDPDSPSRNYPQHRKWLRECKIPLLMQKHYDEFPSSIAFPREEVKAIFNKNFIVNEKGASFTEYTNQISWLLALTIAMGYKEIHVYGVDMAAASEYSFQRSSCQFFIGYAAGAGIKVLIPKTSELCKFPRDYGFETDNYNRNLTKIRIKAILKMINDMNAQKLDIHYQRQAYIKKYEQNLNELDIQKKIIDEDILKTDLVIFKNNEYVEHIQDENIKNKIIVQNETLAKVLLELKEKQKEVDDKILIEERNNSINEQSVEEAIREIENKILLHQGAISECKYVLNNNLI